MTPPASHRRPTPSPPFSPLQATKKPLVLTVWLHRQIMFNDFFSKFLLFCFWLCAAAAAVRPVKLTSRTSGNFFDSKLVARRNYPVFFLYSTDDLLTVTTHDSLESLNRVDTTGRYLTLSHTDSTTTLPVVSFLKSFFVVILYLRCHDSFHFSCAAVQ